MGLVSTLGLALGASWASGLRLYAAVATLGLLGRFAGLELPGELAVVETPWVITLALILFGVEFVADKVPLVDSMWDAVHTFVRVPAGTAPELHAQPKVSRAVFFLVVDIHQACGGGVK